MSLVAGTRLGPYEIQSAIGAGGMGEVYRARDTRLDRTVAIKVLPPDVSGDPERRARFEREGKTVAGLSHPHICPLFDVGDHDGAMFLVMEHLAGQTLAERLEKGALPLEQALTVATEIADALSAAHRQGVIHRDLKPGNVMLTKGGAKLLDFGLAKLTGHGEQPAAVHMVSAAATQAPLTGQGVIVGTLQYMAPEQLEAKPADARTDLWALGAILYEMATGKRAFEGSSAVSLMAAILDHEPLPIASLQPLAPAALDRLVRQCLAKSPDDRPDTAHDVANELRWVRETTGDRALPGMGLRRPHLLRSAAVVVGAVVLTAALTSWLWARWRPPLSSTPPVRMWLDVWPAEELNAGGSVTTAWRPGLTPGGSHTGFAWTPDGRALVFVGRRAGTQQLYVRALDGEEARPLAGTEDAQVPAVSPDGQWVAFWAAETLKKVALVGGPVVDVARRIRVAPVGVSWDDHGNLFFGKTVDRHIWKVSAEGTLMAVTTGAETDWAQILPSPLPGGRALLYTVRKREWSWGDEEIVAQTLATGTRKVLLSDAADARYLPSGHLVFLRRGTLFAVAFDPERLELRSTPQAVQGEVAQALTGSSSDEVTGAGQFAIAPTGTLAWLPGPLVPYASGVLVSVDRQGRVSPLAAPEKSYFMGARLPPGGRQLAVAVRDLSEINLWTYTLPRGPLTPTSARGGEVYSPVWTPDGQRLVFHWLKDGRSSLAFQPADGTTPPEVLGIGAGVSPSSWTPDGRHLVVVTYDDDLAVVTIETGRASMQTLARSPYLEASPEFSPDGDWLAYTSDDSGRNEVYVQAYPALGPRRRVSLDGGESPAWRANGRELFFLSLQDTAGKCRMMVARFEPGSPPRVGAPQPLFQFASRELGFRCRPVRCYGVAPDGQQFYTVQGRPPPTPAAVTHVNIVLNWLAELKAKVPPAR